jgi:hypothetical protein
MTSLLISAVQHRTICVDNNLSGVSRQVTAPGVLSFGQILAALRAGKEHLPQTRVEEFARTRARQSALKLLARPH